MKIGSSMRGVLALGAVLLGFVSAAADGLRDGTWWKTISVEAQTAFAAGFIDCATYDANETRLSDSSWHELQAQTSEHYRALAKDSSRPVVSVMMQVARPRKLPSQPGGEVYPGKHGIFDGNFWRMMKADQQLAFLDGYLDCLKAQRVKAPVFLRPAEWYRSKVSDWFGTKPEDQGAIRSDREEEKIANVLWRFGDPS